MANPLPRRTELQVGPRPFRKSETVRANDPAVEGILRERPGLLLVTVTRIGSPRPVEVTGVLSAQERRPKPKRDWLAPWLIP